MKRIGFNINGVLRDFTDSFRKNYEVKFGGLDDNQNFDLSVGEKIYEFFIKEENDYEYSTKDSIIERIISIERIRKGDEDEFEYTFATNEFDLALKGQSNDYEIKEVTRFVSETPNPYDLMNSFGFASPTELSRFLFEDFIIEIFGSSDESYKNCTHHYNEVVTELRKQGYESILLSKENGKVRSSTLYFLANNGCETDSIKFVEKDSDYWKFVDVLVTDNPNILKSIPEGKIGVKLNKPYNANIVAHASIDKIEDLKNNITIITNL